MKPQRSFYVPPSNLKLILALVIAASFTFASARATAATLPPGFVEAQVGGNLSGSPTAMAFAPDGRLFVCQQGGQLRVIKTVCCSAHHSSALRSIPPANAAFSESRSIRISPPIITSTFITRLRHRQFTTELAGLPRPAIPLHRAAKSLS